MRLSPLCLLLPAPLVPLAPLAGSLIVTRGFFALAPVYFVFAFACPVCRWLNVNEHSRNTLHTPHPVSIVSGARSDGGVVKTSLNPPLALIPSLAKSWRRKKKKKGWKKESC